MRLSTLCLVLSIACASAPAKPAPPVLTAATSGIFVSAFDGDPALDRKVAGAHVLIDDSKASDTDGAGNASFDGLLAGNHRFTLEAPGYVTAAGDFTTPHPDPLNVSLVKVTPDTPTGHEHGFLHVCGTDFCDEDGHPWLFAGYANYVPIAQIAKGQDLGPIFDEAAGYGANTLVALGMDLGDWATANGFRVDPRDPQWATWLATLFDTAAQRHMRVALGVFQQAQALSLAEQRAVWETAVKVARGRWNVILRLGNEDDVNGWRHGDFSKPSDLGGVLVSTGSRGINNPPVPPNWDFAEWESRREPLHKAMDDAGAGVLEQHAGYPGFPPYLGPIVVIEPPFFNDTTPDLYGDTRWTDPKLALQLGLEIGANSAGGTFGSSLGLVGRPNGPGAAECARQFFRGLRAGFQR